MVSRNRRLADTIRTLVYSRPAQADLIESMQDFAELHGSRCRQHVKRWDEWSCAGPHGMRITLQKERGKNRFLAEFTLVILEDGYADDYREYVDQFVGYMDAKFGDAVVYAGH